MIDLWAPLAGHSPALVLAVAALAVVAKITFDLLGTVAAVAAAPAADPIGARRRASATLHVPSRDPDAAGRPRPRAPAG